MCGECRTLTLATDPNDGSKLEIWLPHNNDDLYAGHVWIGVTEDNEEIDSNHAEQASIMLSPEEQDQLVSWIQERRRERAGEDN